MIKRILLIVCLIMILGTSLSAQESVFILVDLSGNPTESKVKITDEMRTEAINLVRQLILNKFDPNYYPDWNLVGNTASQIQAIYKGAGEPLIREGGYLMIMPLGDRDTYKKFEIHQVTRYPQDVESHFPIQFEYNQQRTYREIAEAKAANIAVQQKLPQYYQIVITSLGQDRDINPNYTEQEKTYLDNFRNATVNGLAIFRHNREGVDYRIEISKIIIPGMTQQPEPAQTGLEVKPGELSEEQMKEPDTEPEINSCIIFSVIGILIAFGVGYYLGTKNSEKNAGKLYKPMIEDRDEKTKKLEEKLRNLKDSDYRIKVKELLNIGNVDQAQNLIKTEENVIRDMWKEVYWAKKNMGLKRGTEWLKEQRKPLP